VAAWNSEFRNGLTSSVVVGLNIANTRRQAVTVKLGLTKTDVGKPMDLNALYYRQMRDVIKRSGVAWLGWHGFRRGLASNLNRLGVDDSVIQAILRHSDIAVTQRCYIKTVRPEAIAAMRKLSATLAEVTISSDGTPRPDNSPTTSSTVLQ